MSVRLYGFVVVDRHGQPFGLRAYRAEERYCAEQLCRELAHEIKDPDARRPYRVEELWHGDDAASERDLLLGALQLAYRKHVRGDEEIGWIELEDALHDALVQAMGAEGFLAWNEKGGGE